MLADDEPYILEDLKNGIDWNSLNAEIVYAAGDGCKVKEYLSNNSVDLLILDIEMPGLTGIDIARLVYDNNIPSKIIFLTAYSEFQYARAALSYGVSEYVLKEDYVETLESVVKKVLATVDKKSNDLVDFVEKFLIQEADGIEKERFVARWNETEFVTVILKLENKGSFFETNSVVRKLQQHFEQCNIIIDKLSLYEYLCLIPAGCEMLKRRLEDIISYIKSELNIQCRIGISGKKSDISLLRESFIEAYEAINNVRTNDILFYSNIKGSNLVDTVCRIIGEKYGNKDLSLRTLANETYTSASYLSRKFSQEKGVTITEYINHHRIKKAVELFDTTDMFVYEVAERVGIDDSAYFSDLFKKYIGVSPKNYKKEN